MVYQCLSSFIFLTFFVLFLNSTYPNFQADQTPPYLQVAKMMVDSKAVGSQDPRASAIQQPPGELERWRFGGAGSPW